MSKRQSNRTERRIAPKGEINQETLAEYAKRARYVGSALHKRHPVDYGFHPAINPRATKSLCDGSRTVTLAQARALFREGIRRGMVSSPRESDLPKYVWAVDSEGNVYEAKRGNPKSEYHGYELGGNEPTMRRVVEREWRSRNGE